MCDSTSPPADDLLELPSPIRDGQWVDAHGTCWRLRGKSQDVREKRAEQLDRSPEVGVLLFYGPDAPTEVAPADREALWQRVRPYVRERYQRAPGDYTDFNVGGFKNNRRRSLLIIEASS